MVRNPLSCTLLGEHFSYICGSTSLPLRIMVTFISLTFIFIMCIVPCIQIIIYHITLFFLLPYYQSIKLFHSFLYIFHHINISKRGKKHTQSLYSVHFSCLGYSSLYYPRLWFVSYLPWTHMKHRIYILELKLRIEKIAWIH